MRLIGPVLLYDMIRIARRGRFILFRALYAAFLGFLFFLAYQSAFSWRYYRTQQVSPQELTEFAQEFFLMFVIVQYVFVVLMTPAYVAGAIAEEKERRTLEFMLTTCLESQEILLNKLLSRLANAFLFVMAGLPILSLIQLFGGVNPGWLWFSFACTALTVVSLGALSIWISVHSRRPRQAIMATYMLVLGYFLVWILLLAGWSYMYYGTRWDYLDGFGKVYAVTLEIFQAGNPIYAGLRATGERSMTGLNGKLSLLELLRNFAVFHGMLTLVCLSYAMLRLRPVYMKQTYGAPKKEGKAGFRHRRRKPVYEPAMMWKELHGDAPRMSLGAKLMYALLVVGCVFPLVIVLYEQLRHGFRFWQEAMNVYMRVVGTILSLLTLLVIVVRAGTSIGTERDRQTMESLLSTPLTDREILKAKWLGSITGAWPMFVLVFLVWGLGLLSGGVHILAIPIMIGFLACYVMLMASMGLMWSAGAKTTTRGLMWSIASAIVWGGGHWIITGFLMIPLAFAMQEWPYLFLLGFTPPFVLGFAPFSWDLVFNMPTYSGPHPQIVGLWFFSFVGVATSLIFAMVFWSVALERFRKSEGRALLRETAHGDEPRVGLVRTS